MIAYKLAMSGGKHPIPVLTFADEKYRLLEEFLLAEARNFGTEIVSFLEEDDGQEKELTGNVFGLKMARGQVEVVNELTGKSCQVSVKDALEVLRAYVEWCEQSPDSPSQGSI